MNIIIFDDDMSFIESMKKSLIELNIKHNGIFTEPTYINKVDDIIAYVYANGNNASLYTLDIMADDEPVGFTIAEHIKKVNKNNLVVYVTDYKDQILTDNIKYKRIALGFICKESKKFLYEMEYVLQEAHEIYKEVFFIGERFKKIIKVKYEDIYYFKKNKRAYDITVVHRNGSDIINGNITNLIKKLNDHFIIVAREFVVNTQAIIRIDQTERIIFFENGGQCPYSVRRGKDLLNKCKSQWQYRLHFR